MKTFKEFILVEALDSTPARIIPKKIDFEGTSRYEFDIGKNKYWIHFYKEKNNSVYIDFALVDQETGGQDLSLTNTGNAHKVLVTVISCIKNHIKKIAGKFSYLEFLAAENEKGDGIDRGMGARAKIYTRLVKMHFPENMYRVTIETNPGGEVEYKIYPKDKK